MFHNQTSHRYARLGLIHRPSVPKATPGHRVPSSHDRSTPRGLGQGCRLWLLASRVSRLSRATARAAQALAALSLAASTRSIRQICPAIAIHIARRQPHRLDASSHRPLYRLRPPRPRRRATKSNISAATPLVPCIPGARQSDHAGHRSQVPTQNERCEPREWGARVGCRVGCQ